MSPQLSPHLFIQVSPPFSESFLQYQARLAGPLFPTSFESTNAAPPREPQSLRPQPLNPPPRHG